LVARIFRNWYPKFHYFQIAGKKEEKIREIQNVLYTMNVPIVFGIGLPNSFLTGKKDIVYSSTVKGNFHHAMCIVGWDTEKQAFLIQNSWGEEWGDSGRLWAKQAWVIENAYSLSYPYV
jgi:C1A family cysteine protease